MVEFRTGNPAEEATEEAAGSLDKHINKVIHNVKNDPEIKAQLVQRVQEGDIPPVLLKAIDPSLVDMAEQSQEQPAESAEVVETKTVSDKPSPEKVMSFVDEIIKYKGEDTTLGEIKEWCEENPTMLKVAIQQEF